MIEGLASDVDHAVAGGDIVRRAAMLQRVTDLFMDNASRLSDDQVEAFDIVILRLARAVESVSRITLSEGIADVANAPFGVVRDLAYDSDVCVAGPVLSRSERLAEADVVAIAQVSGQDHLHCVSRRRTLSERVTDVLLTRGDGRVVGTVAGNAGACVSQRGFGTLTDKAQDDAALRAVLERRCDLPPEHRLRIVAIAGERVAEPAPIAECAIDETTIVAWLGDGRITEALAAVARIAHVPTEIAVEAHRAAEYDAMLFLLRSIRFGWGTLKLFIQAKPGKALSPEDLRGAFAAFQALSVNTAQRVVRFTVARDAPSTRGAA